MRPQHRIATVTAASAAAVVAFIIFLSASRSSKAPVGALPVPNTLESAPHAYEMSAKEQELFRASRVRARDDAAEGKVQLSVKVINFTLAHSCQLRVTLNGSEALQQEVTFNKDGFSLTSIEVFPGEIVCSVSTEAGGASTQSRFDLPYQEVPYLELLTLGVNEFGVYFYDDSGNRTATIGGRNLNLMPSYDVPLHALALRENIPVGSQVAISAGSGEPLLSNGYSTYYPLKVAGSALQQRHAGATGILEVHDPQAENIFLIAQGYVIPCSQERQGDRLIFSLSALDLKEALCSARGSLVDTYSRKPIQSLAAVSLLRSRSNRRYILREVDSLGRFEIRGIPPGEWLLLVQPKGYERVITPIELRPSEQLDLGEISLRPAATVIGSIKDREGNSVIVDVWVGSSEQSGSDRPLGTTSDRPVDSNGNYGVFQLPPGALIVGIQPNDSWAMSPQYVNAKSGILTRLDLEVQSGTILSLHSEQDRVPGVSAQLLCADGTQYWSGDVEGDSSVYFRVPPGEYVVKWEQKSETIEVQAERIDVKLW